MMIFEF